MFWFRDWNLPIETSLECLGHASEASLRGRRRPTNQRAAEHLNTAVVLPTALDRHTAQAHTTPQYRASATQGKKLSLRACAGPGSTSPS